MKLPDITPGPWTPENIEWMNTPDSGGYRMETINCPNHTICHVMADEEDEEQAANVKAIAALPDLLVALETLRSVISGPVAALLTSDSMSDTGAYAALYIADAALIKAGATE